MAKKEINPNLILAGGAILLVYLGGRSIFQKLGLVQSDQSAQAAADVQNQMIQLQQGNYFDPDFYKTGGPGTLILTVSAATTLSRILYNSKGTFNDDEAAVYGVFQQLKTRSQVSFLASVFFNIYKKSLIGYLSGFLNAVELATVAKITNKLPSYKI